MWWWLASCTSAPGPGEEPDPGEQEPTVSPTVSPPGPDCEGVATTTGCMTGTAMGSGREAFLGVPFAEPPARFSPPASKRPWEGVLRAESFGPPCVQFSDSVLGTLLLGEGSEDCLTLNVFRPPDARDLPVLFFVHGGGHVTGSGSEPYYTDDPELAEAAVVVTTQYRLGPLGFLAHPALSEQDPEGVSGNVGFQDVLMALDWVRANAEALGGDPDQVLVFGESAGGLETCALLASPRAAGRFAAAVIESAPCGWIQAPLRDAPLDLDGEAQGEQFEQQVGCSGDVAACLRDLPLETLVEAGQSEGAPLGEGWNWGPWLDGVWLPADPLGEVLARGDWNQVPVLATINADEGSIFTLGLAPTRAALDLWLDQLALVFGLDRGALAAQYDPDVYGSPGDAFSALYGDLFFVCPTLFQQELLAQHVPAPGAWFTHEAEVLGAFHGSEIPYVFGTLSAASEGELALSEEMRALWTSMPVDPAVSEGWVQLEVGGRSVIGAPRAQECELMRDSRANPYR
jgi:para-nitrobenzyl esterase